MDKSFITFNLRSTSTTKYLGVEIQLDNQTVYNNDHFQQTQLIKIPVDNTDADHVLKIILKNKTAEHTVLDSLGAIVQDANIIIEQLAFDNHIADYNILQFATYTHDCNGTAELKQRKFYGEMGCNGTVEFKFVTPIYLWLLENT